MEGYKLTTETWDKIKDIPFDYMYQKHELTHWKDGYHKPPYCYEILGKSIIIDPYLSPPNFDVLKAWLSKDEQIMTVVLYHKEYEEPYFALATWQEEVQMFITFIYHCTYIADWQNFKTIFEKNNPNTEGV